MTKTPLVSVVMPAYNAERYITESIDSVLAQTYANWELIIVNDGSTDKTASMVDQFVKQHKNIHHFMTTNHGPGPARNFGIKKAAGALIAFLDADDLWLPHKLTCQMDKLTDGKYDMVFTSGSFIDGTSADQFVSAVGSFDGPTMLSLLYKHNRIPTLSVVAARVALEKAGLFRPSGLLSRKCEDYDLWLRMAAADCTFYGLEEKLVQYRLHTGGASSEGLLMIKAEQAAITPYNAQMNTSVPGMFRKRMAELDNRLAAQSAHDGKLSEAANYLKKLNGNEAGWSVGIKTIALKLTGRKYSGVYHRWLHRLP